MILDIIKKDFPGTHCKDSSGRTEGEAPKESNGLKVSGLATLSLTKAFLSAIKELFTGAMSLLTPFMKSKIFEA